MIDGTCIKIMAIPGRERPSSDYADTVDSVEDVGEENGDK
jgi:hypothetical protein